jgi:hypothetical protein
MTMSPLPASDRCWQSPPAPRASVECPGDCADIITSCCPAAGIPVGDRACIPSTPTTRARTSHIQRAGLASEPVRTLEIMGSSYETPSVPSRQTRRRPTPDAGCRPGPRQDDARHQVAVHRNVQAPAGVIGREPACGHGPAVVDNSRPASGPASNSDDHSGTSIQLWPGSPRHGASIRGGSELAGKSASPSLA